LIADDGLQARRQLGWALERRSLAAVTPGIGIRVEGGFAAAAATW
jgi:hypothetical protein